MGDKIPETLRSLLRQKLIDAVLRPLPQLTRRDTWIPRIPGKTLAVIGMRRSGKTSLLWQQVGERLAAGAERAWLPLVSFEDERLLPSPLVWSCARCSRPCRSRSVQRLRPG
jgi:hypothetical protein